MEVFLEDVLFNHREEVGEKMGFSRQVLTDSCLFSILKREISSACDLEPWLRGGGISYQYGSFDAH